MILVLKTIIWFMFMWSSVIVPQWFLNQTELSITLFMFTNNHFPFLLQVHRTALIQSLVFLAYFHHWKICDTLNFSLSILDWWLICTYDRFFFWSKPHTITFMLNFIFFNPCLHCFVLLQGVHLCFQTSIFTFYF